MVAGTLFHLTVASLEHETGELRNGHVADADWLVLDIVTWFKGILGPTVGFTVDRLFYYIIIIIFER